MRLEGKTVLVTASGQGIGRAVALAAAAEGARTIATDVAPDKLADLAGRVAATHRLDVTDGSAIAALAARTGRIDALCNVAGFVHHGSILDATEAELDFALDLNVRSMFRTIRAFLPGMIAAGQGSIVNMASVVSSQKGLPFRAVYGTTKAAVIGLTKAVAADTIGTGVRCNAIAPGTVQSPSLDERIAAFDDPAQARRDFIARQPIGRLGTPEEIAALAIHLCADESAYTTGAVFVADGGLTL